MNNYTSLSSNYLSGIVWLVVPSPNRLFSKKAVSLTSLFLYYIPHTSAAPNTE